MRRGAVAVLAAVVAGGLATLSPGQAAPPGSLAATVSGLPDASEARRYRTYDAGGARGRDALWHVTRAGGNCCEVYVASTPSGRLVEFGGMYLAFSDDRGGSWQQVEPDTTVMVGGEGAVAAAPNGDVVGVGWHAYTADHLQAFRYDAEARTWAYSVVALHEPFHDRPWITVVPGPFPRPDGTTAPYATVVRANYLSSTKETFLVSLDGLTYVPTSDLAHLWLGLGRTTGYLEPASVPALDFVQPHRESRMAALAGGGMLNLGVSGTCPAAILSRTQEWSCFAMADHALTDALVVDSRGRLHEVEPDLDGGLAYRMSRDGGRTWEETTLAMPHGDAVIDASTQLDHKANGALGVAAVAARVRIGDVQQDVVFRVDTSGAVPRLVETLYVGLGDMATGQGISETGERYDFVSLAILPDGTFATSFHDSLSPDPMLAVEVREAPRTTCRRRC